ncbi:MAG: hypothetical protein ACR2H3_14615 [Acidimicrobiales bacterium]
MARPAVARFGSAGHLVRRFVGMLDPRGPAPVDDTWAQSHLVDGERALWNRMSGPDRRHAIGVARRTVAMIGSPTPRPVIAAALLHDVGKVEAGLGAVGRAVATLAGMVSPARAADGDGRIARYLTHDRRGAGSLEAAGADPLTVAWAAEHHRPPAGWTVPTDVANALKAADDD